MQRLSQQLGLNCTSLVVTVGVTSQYRYWLAGHSSVAHIYVDEACARDEAVQTKHGHHGTCNRLQLSMCLCLLIKHCDTLPTLASTYDLVTKACMATEM